MGCLAICFFRVYTSPSKARYNEAMLPIKMNIFVFFFWSFNVDTPDARAAKAW